MFFFLISGFFRFGRILIPETIVECGIEDQYGQFIFQTGKRNVAFCTGLDAKPLKYTLSSL